MPNVQDVLAAKGSKVHTTSPGTNVLDATAKMNHHKIGALVVMDGDQVAGIFTERDVLRRVVGASQPPEAMLVAEVMTSDVVCCNPDADIDEVGALMKEHRIRHVPVCDRDSHLAGLISMGDINAHHASTQAAQIHFLNDYIYGRV